MAHGDLKPDNILVTSYDWLFLVDINPMKPVQALDTDLKTYNMYFGDLDNNNRCYLAPERWITPPKKLDENAVLSPAMDVFSAGCIIAEILSDGVPLFDLPKLQQYRHSTFDPEKAMKERIRDPKLITLIMEMIDLNPEKRPTSTECLDRWNATVFPDSFHTIFFQLFS
jgi:phosphoinositide-3-kinase regulatory subunit 4